MPDGPPSGVRATTRFRLAAGSAILLVIGVLGPWQKTLFGISGNGLEVGAVLLVPAVLLAGYAVYEYDRGQADRRRRIGRQLVIAAVLVGLAEIGNADHVGGGVVAGWGAIIAGIGGAGLLVAGVRLLRCA